MLNATNQTLAEKHPFVLKDGRRFATLACAGHSLCGDAWGATWRMSIAGKNELTGNEFTNSEAVDAYSHRNSEEWNRIASSDPSGTS